jgi:hypothetical protein
MGGRFGPEYPRDGSSARTVESAVSHSGGIPGRRDMVKITHIGLEPKCVRMNQGAKMELRAGSGGGEAGVEHSCVVEN